VPRASYRTREQALRRGRASDPKPCAIGAGSKRVPNDTLTAAQAVAKYPWYQPGRVFALLEAFYPIPQGKTMRSVPFMPYLNFSPSAWVLPLMFDGGGYRAGGKAMFDSAANLWVGDNFTVGWQGQNSFWQGNATKFDPNGSVMGYSAWPTWSTWWRT